MSRTKKFIKNTVTTALLQVVVMMTGFILPKIMINYYGSEINGLISSITQLIAYITLVEAGLSGATVYSLYKPLADKNHYKINSILSAARKFYNKTGYIFLSLSVGLALVYPLFIKTDILSYTEVFFLFLILAVNGVLEFFTLAKYRALLTADQKTYVISMASIIQVILNVIIISILSVMGASIVIARLVAILAILLRTIILYIYCKKEYDFIDFSIEPDYTSMNKRWDALYLQVIGIVHKGAPVLIATVLLTLNHVSIYSIYYVVIQGINSILSIFTSGLSAGFGDLLVTSNKDKFKKTFTEFEYVYYILITIVYSVMMITYIPFIRVYTFGADINYIFPSFAIIMTLNGYFYNLKTPYGMLTISAGKYRESRIQISIQGLLEIILGVIFGMKWGLNGIVLGALLSNVYRDIDFIFFAPKHLTRYSFRKTFYMWIRSISIVLVISFFGFMIPTSYIFKYTDWVIFAIIIGIIITLFTIMINAIMDRELFNLVLKRIRSMVKKG